MPRPDGDTLRGAPRERGVKEKPPGSRPGARTRLLERNKQCLQIQTPKYHSPESLDNEIDRLLSAGLENFSVRELLGMMLSAAGQAERSAYLAEATGDKGNGSYDRSLNVGSIPVDIRVPRTRSGQFRPNSLPPAYERGYSDEVPVPSLRSALLRPLGKRRENRAQKDGRQRLPR